MNFMRTVAILTFLLILLFPAFPVKAETSGEWVDKGNTYFDQENYEEAIECYNEAIGIDPENTIAWYNKGAALFNLGDYQRAIYCYNTVLEFDPYDSDAKKAREKAMSALNGESMGDSETGSETSGQTLKEAIETNIINQYGFNDSIDKLERYDGDFDKDGQEEVFILLRKIQSPERWPNEVQECLSIFIFKPFYPGYKLVFQDTLSPCMPFSDLTGLEKGRAEVKILETENCVFLGFKTLASRGASSQDYVITVYSYNPHSGKYDLVGQKNGVFVDFFQKGSSVYITKTWTKYYRSDLCNAAQKTTTEYFRWNGEEFVYDYEEDYHR